MAHKGLSPDAVVKAAVELIEQQGRDAFSMRLLADQLGIKTASLYNHVENMETLLSEVCRYGMCLQKEAEMQAIEGWHGEEAVRFLAETYRSFAKEHRELYWLIMNMAAKDSRVLDDAAAVRAGVAVEAEERPDEAAEPAVGSATANSRGIPTACTGVLRNSSSDRPSGHDRNCLESTLAAGRLRRRSGYRQAVDWNASGQMQDTAHS